MNLVVELPPHMKKYLKLLKTIKVEVVVDFRSIIRSLKRSR